MGIRKYIIKVLNGMALGLFSSLIIGLILKQLGILIHQEILINSGIIAQHMMAPAIGAGVAYSITKSPLGIFSGLVAGAIGGGAISINADSTIISIGEPVGALVSSLIGVILAKKIEGRTKVDIILVPAVTIVIGGIAGEYLSPIISKMMTAIGEIINFATMQQPIIMGILISLIMGIILTLPISSAAIGISLGLNGLAAGAAIIGCSCHMVGFAIASFRENGIGGLISQGLGTSMIQISNIVKKPIIALPAIISSIILGPIGTTVFKMEGDKIGSGMGTSGLVGQFSTINAMGVESVWKIAIMHFLLPAIISTIISEYMRKKGIIKYGDMKLNIEEK
ncbi:MAG: PTS sugar transporter subunit IIC [Andreesenia angusta]|nr:PTS sugar transporter subunit IIC [Andreesenia angusta]